ncbi:hypothetical protein AB0F81_41490 [Actinoplanes sp. NPDC024001]|uniref:hypothetical protein n=1 Tax=Actinoplanes sp. NPDC024001 TaxID=3154598 RepID=UPI0033EF8636
MTGSAHGPWRDVLLFGGMVASDGYTTAVGATTRLALQIDCQSWAPAGEPDRGAPAVEIESDGKRIGYELVGEVLATRSQWADGWALSAYGIAFYVLETHARGEPPAAGSLVRVRGQLCVAEDYVTELFEPREQLRDCAVRTWKVQRIVRLGHSGDRRVPMIDRRDAGQRGFLLDLRGSPAPAGGDQPISGPRR